MTELTDELQQYTPLIAWLAAMLIAAITFAIIERLNK